MLEVTVGSIVSVGILDAIGLFLNIWLLYTVKARVPAFNAIDVLQVIKIVLVLLALVLSVWLEFLPCTSINNKASAKLCIISQELTEDCFFHSLCWTLVTVALVRKKVCECRGRAAVLITKKYGLKTWMLCLTPVCIFAAVSMSLLIQADPHLHESEAGLQNSSASMFEPIGELLVGLSTHTSLPFVACHTLALNFLPIVVLCILYTKIYRDVRQTAQAVNDLVQNRNRDPSKGIIRALIIHLTLTCTLWVTYTCVRLITFSLGITHLYITIVKLLILIAHPFGEGLLQPSTQKPPDRIHQGIQNRFNRQIYPNTDASISDFQTAKRSTSFIQATESIPIGVAVPTTSVRRKMTIQYTNPVYEEIRKQSTVLQTNSTPRGRKESHEQLRKALKVLGDDQTSITQMRRLSTTLRFPIGTFDDRDLYETYDTQNSPVLSSCRRLIETGNIYEGHVIPESHDRKLHGTGDPDTPQRRWKRLFTTAKSVRKFSRAKQSRCALESCLEESETQVLGDIKMENIPSTDTFASIPTGSNVGRYIADDTNKKSPGQNFDATVSNKVDPSGKKKMRSISCVNNEWAPQNDKGTTREKKIGATHASSYDAPRTSFQSPSSILRSISCDTKIYMKFQSQRQTDTSHHRGLGSRYSRYSRDNVVIDEHATRKECIKKLLEMREYF